MYLSECLQNKFTENWDGDYNSSIGRFISEDELEIIISDVNKFRYTRNSPISYIDPSGNDRVEVLLKNGTHVGLLIFDPQMPGNAVLIDFGPDFSKNPNFGAVMDVFLNRSVPGVVDINYDVLADIGLRIPGTIIEQSREDDFRDILRAYELQDAAIKEELLYQLFDFNDDDNSVNCRGFVDKTI